eukprot:3688616-Rhodomonas_salina.1
MGFGGTPKGADGKKHELSQWDVKTATFPDHSTNMQKMMSSYNITFIIDTGRALFVKNNKKREETRPFDQANQLKCSAHSSKTKSGGYF